MNDATETIFSILVVALSFMFWLRIWDSGERPYRDKYSYRRLMRRLHDDDYTTYTHYSKKTKGKK